MKLFNNQARALLLVATVAIALPAYAMKNEEVDTVSCEQQNEQAAAEMWYKNGSTQRIASAVVICSVVAYAIAMRMGKISSPVALVTALCAPKVAQAVMVEVTGDVKNNDIVVPAVTDKDKIGNDADNASDMTGDDALSNDDKDIIKEGEEQKSLFDTLMTRIENVSTQKGVDRLRKKMFALNQ